MDGYWKGFGLVGKQQGPISISNECFKFLDSLIVMIDKRNIYTEMKQPQLNITQSSKQLNTLALKIKQVVLRLQKLFKEPNKQTKDLSTLVKQKEDSLIAFLNQFLASRKDTKYINQRASQICYSQKNRTQLVALIEKMTKDKETIKQIQNYLKPGLQSSTGKVKGILQQNKKVKQFQQIFYQHETRIWQLFRYTQNQGKKETFNSNNSKKGSEKYLQTYVKLDQMRIFMRSLDQKLKSYRDQKAKQWEERLGKPIDRLLHLMQNKQPIHNQINRILINMHTNKHESFQTDINNCDKSTQQILRKIKTELETSAANARRICDKINDKIKFYFKKVSVDNTSKLYNTNSILGEIYKSFSDYESLFEIYESFVKQINNLSFVNESSQTKLQQRLKAYIKDLQQVDNRIKMYALPNIFPFKNEVAKSKDQNQMKMISIKQYEQSKKIIAQIERYKLTIRTIQKENEENKQKRESYIKQLLQKTQSITQQKLKNLQHYNLQNAKLQKLQQQYQKAQKVINSLKINEQQLLKKLKSLTEQLQRVKRQLKQKQKQKQYQQNTILSSKQIQARMTNQKTVLLQKSRFLKAQISKLNESFKQEKEQFKEHLSKGVVYYVDNANKKNSLLLIKIEILQKRIYSIMGLFKTLKVKIQKSKIKIQFLKSTVEQLNTTKEQTLRAVKNQKLQRQKLSEYISTLNSLFSDQKTEAKGKQLQMDKQKNQINDLSLKIQQQKIEYEQLIKIKQVQIQDLRQETDRLKSQIKTINDQNQKYNQHKKLEFQNVNQQMSALKITIQLINSDNKSIQNKQQEIENKKLQISGQIQITVADKDLYIQNKQKQEQQITHLKDIIKVINEEKQLCIKDSKLKIDNLQKQIDDLKKQRQQFIAENKILISNQQIKIENKEKQIIGLKRQIQLTNEDKQFCVQNNQLKNDHLQNLIHGLKNQIQQIIAENQIRLSNQQLQNDNKEKYIIELKKQIQLINANKQLCIQTNKLEIDKLIQQIVGLKNKIQSVQAERQSIDKEKQLETAKQKEQLSQLNARMQQLQTQNQNLKQQSTETNSEQQELSKQPYLKQSNVSFDSQSWFCDHQQTLITAKSLIKQISHINKKLVKNATLLYRYSPQNKLDWNHFVNKNNVLIIIKTATNKMIAVYTLAPLMKPGGPQYTGDEKAFIFESNLNGNDQCFYPMLEGKKANACYGNIVSIGKSDLRFGLKDDMLEGNFGYKDSFFDTKVKITQLFGSTNKEPKVKMLAYEIYEVTLDHNTMGGKYGKDVRDQTGQRVRQEYYLNALQESEGEKNSLRQKIEELTTEATQKHKQIEALKIEIQLIKQQQSKRNIQTILQFDKLNLQFKDLQDNLTKQKRNNFDLLEQNKKCQLQIKRLQAQVDKQKIISSLNEKEVKQKDIRIQQMNHEICSLKEKNDEAAVVVANKQKDVQSLEDKINKLQKQLQAAQQHEKPVNLNQSASTSRSTETMPSVSQQLMSSKSSQEFRQNICRINTKKYSQLAQRYKIDALLVAHISTLFVNQLLNQQFEMKLRLVNFIESFRKSPISNTKLVYKYDPNNLTTFHKYIDDTKNLVLVVKTVSGVFLATYYSGKYTKGELLTSASLLMTLTYNNSFELYNAITNPQVQRAFRGMVYDDFFLIFGNAELRIRANEKIIFSNFGIGNSFFNPRGKKVHDLIGQGQKREIEFVSYEIFEVSFFDEE